MSGRKLQWGTMLVGVCLLGEVTVVGEGLELSHAQGGATDLTELSPEQLLKVEVTSVSKHEESLFQAPSAVAVVTAEDIRRSGVTSIPEALRLVPGLEVARVDSHDWAVSSRGFNELYANKLLVLVDGRSVYTPLFSGVFWDVQDTLLEDIDRIEVIRGPGATLWGANAVNGVINVITRSARETQGWLASAGGGTEERGFGQVRYGGQAGENVFYRTYVKYFNRDDSVQPSGQTANDAWSLTRGGFRMDWEPAPPTQVTVQGDLYYGDMDQTYVLPSFPAPSPRLYPGQSHVGGGNFLVRLARDFGADSRLEVQAYYDQTERNTTVLDESRQTVDLDLHHHFAVSRWQRLSWGLGYRFEQDDQDQESFVLSLDPEHRDTHTYSSFIQTELDLVEDRLTLTLGTKVEHNDYTGFEVQPGARLAWLVHPRHTLWTSVARAVRTPSRVENDGRIVIAADPGPPANATALVGNSDYDSEELLAYELGYRAQLHPRVSVDLAAFYNDYDRLRSFRPGSPRLETEPVPPYLLVPLVVGNDLEGETYGAELALEYAPRTWWRWRASYTYLQMQLHAGGTSLEASAEEIEGSSPHHQVSLRSSLDLPYDLTFDAVGRYVDHLSALDIPSYFNLDVRLGWQLHPNWELAIVGQNLLQDQHSEFRASYIVTQPAEIQRGVYGSLTVKF